MTAAFVRGICLVFAMGIATGCSMKFGGLEPNTQFVYPNSNVKVLGPVSASMTKIGILMLGGFFSGDDIRSVYREALAQREGANVIVNFNQDTVSTVWGLVTVNTYSISGDAASMEVGKKRLY